MTDQPKRLKKVRGVNIFNITIKGVLYWRVVVPKFPKGRITRTFRSPIQARHYYETEVVKVRNSGRRTLTQRQEREAIVVFDALKSSFENVSLLSVFEFYAKHHIAIGASVTVSEAIQKLLAAKKADGKSDRYLGDLRSRLARFAEDYGDCKIAEIDSAQIGNWLRSLALAARTRNTYHLRLCLLFKYAIEQCWAQENPLTKSMIAKTHKAPTGILSPEQFGSLLSNASAETSPFWILGGFAGIRSAEIMRLAWSDIDWEHRLIKIDDTKSKTARERFVDICDAALAWLAPYRGSTGAICPISGSHLYERLEADRKRAGLPDPWPSNALRHSFGSYHLAYHNDAGKLSLQMGHMTASMVFEHYRLRVLPTEAAKWWSIYPEASSKIVNIPA
jgi:integrase